MWRSLQNKIDRRLIRSSIRKPIKQSTQYVACAQVETAIESALMQGGVHVLPSSSGAAARRVIRRLQEQQKLAGAIDLTTVGGTHCNLKPFTFQRLAAFKLGIPDNTAPLHELVNINSAEPVALLLDHCENVSAYEFKELVKGSTQTRKYVALFIT